MKMSSLVGLLAFVVTSAAGDPINTLKDLGPALGSCWHAPEGSTGQQVTIIFSLNRSGAVMGKPRITYMKLVGDNETQQAFVAAALGALEACTPVAVTPGLGGAIAGRPLSIHFIGGPNGTAL